MSNLQSNQHQASAATDFVIPSPRTAYVNMVPSKSFWHWFRLSWQMGWADIKSSFADNFMGFIWWIADPLVNLLIYYVIFNMVFKVQVPYFTAFLFVNLVVWRWVSVTMVNSTGAVVGNAQLLKQVYLPKFMFSFRIAMAETINLMVAMVFVAGVMVLSGVPANPTILALPLVFLLTVLLVLPCSVALSLMAPFFPDLRSIVNFAFRGLVFLSGVFYDIRTLPEMLKKIFMLNPFAIILQMFRDVLLYNQLPTMSQVLYIMAWATPGIIAAFVLHAAVDRKLVKWIY